MPECSNCTAYVTSQYIRVFGTNGTVNGCPECGNTYGQHGGRNQ